MSSPYNVYAPPPPPSWFASYDFVGLIWNTSTLQVNDVNFENMSNDDAVRVLREMVHKPG